jgi:beclin
LFWNRRLDNGMVALLECLQCLGRHVETTSTTGGVKIPYAIQRERIGQQSIRLQFNSETEWTKALKYFLINLKWILVLVSATASATESV